MQRSKLEHGATNWSAVFEAPSAGVIPLIESARSLAALKKCTSLLIRRLFVHEDDAPARAAFEAKLEQILPEQRCQNAHAAADLAAGKAEIDQLLHEIEEERLHHDEALNPPTIEVPAPHPVHHRAHHHAHKQKAAKSHPWLQRLGVGALAVLVFGAIFLSSEHPNKPDAGRLVDQFVKAAEGHAPALHIYGGPLRSATWAGAVAVTAENVPSDACVHVGWVLAKKGKVAINGLMPGIISAAILAELCSQRPNGATVEWRVGE